MPTPRTHGTPVNDPSIPEAIRDALSQLGDSNMARRGLTFGSGANGSDAGRFDAVFARVGVPAAPANVEVSHALARVPTTVSVWEVISGPSGAVVAIVNSIQKKDWTATTLKIAVIPLAGPTVGAEIVLLVA